MKGSACHAHIQDERRFGQHPPETRHRRHRPARERPHLPAAARAPEGAAEEPAGDGGFHRRIPRRDDGGDTARAGRTARAARIEGQLQVALRAVLRLCRIPAAERPHQVCPARHPRPDLREERIEALRADGAPPRPPHAGRDGPVAV